MASAPCHCWSLTDPAELAASSPALLPHYSALMTTDRQGQRSHVFYSGNSVLVFDFLVEESNSKATNKEKRLFFLEYEILPWPLLQ